MQQTDLHHLIQLLAKLPGLGPRSGRRVALHLLKHRTQVMEPLATLMHRTAETIQDCATCGNLDVISPCGLCQDPTRDPQLLCVVEGVADLWAVERSGAFKGRYHVLGGTLSALEGVGPGDLRFDSLCTRLKGGPVREVILALNATVEGQTTAHYVADLLRPLQVPTTSLAMGVPLGGELDYLDDGTLTTALHARRGF